MARLTYRERKRLSKETFAIPSKAPGGGSYPVPDKAHARSALQRVHQYGNAQEHAAVHRKVGQKFPELLARHLLKHHRGKRRG